MILNTTAQRLQSDPPTKELVDLFEKNEDAFNISGASIYYRFPIYKESEAIVTARLILVSPKHGVVVFAVTDAGKIDYKKALESVDEELDIVFGQLHARLTKQRSLRADKKTLLFNLEPAIFAPNLPNVEAIDDFDTEILTNRNEVGNFLNDLLLEEDLDEVFREICAVIEGAKGLIAPKPRDVTDRPIHSRAVQVNRLESEIRSFDQDQKQGYMEVFEGPQRIRGLAGSGKTVVLAMKAALTHLKYPNATIVYTFYTRSLYQHVRRLITRFYRQYNDQDPNWDKLLVMHAWGGRSKTGVYFRAAIDHGVAPLTYSDVSGYQNPFDAAVTDLLESTTIHPTYDFVIVDEGQDFPASFLKLGLSLARDQRFVYAYDELQNIFQAEIPSAENVFGEGFKLDEDVVLKKCYRNPREVLVCAHSLGFGLYGDKIVQMLENKEHWEDLGYEVRSGDFVEGQQLDIERPRQNSPSSISDQNKIDGLIECNVLNSPGDEIAFVADRVHKDIVEEGLTAEDVVVICADDRYARSYFSQLADQLKERGIRSNNLNADTFAGDVFTRESSVTLSSVHRAKGNEGYSVYVMGADALFRTPTVRTRNLIFTAMTRAKAWLCVTGVGQATMRLKGELDKAKANFPHLRFVYPSRGELRIMRRDLAESAQSKLERALAEVMDDLPEEEVKKMLDRLKAARRKKF